MVALVPLPPSWMLTRRPRKRVRALPPGPPAEPYRGHAEPRFVEEPAGEDLALRWERPPPPPPPGQRAETAVLVVELAIHLAIASAAFAVFPVAVAAVLVVIGLGYSAIRRHRAPPPPSTTIEVTGAQLAVRGDALPSPLDAPIETDGVTAIDLRYRREAGWEVRAHDRDGAVHVIVVIPDRDDARGVAAVLAAHLGLRPPT